MQQMLVVGVNPDAGTGQWRSPHGELEQNTVGWHISMMMPDLAMVPH